MNEWSETVGISSDLHTYVIETWSIKGRGWKIVRVHADSRLKASKVLTAEGFDATKIGDFRQIR
jgi:hypothetical protein